MIIESIDRLMDSRRRVYPCNSNRASEIGFPCERYGIYSRTRWKDKVLPDIPLQYIFDYGNWIEKMALRRMEDAGIELFCQQRDFSEPNQNITGHVDTFAKHGGETFPVEVKSMSPYIYACVDSFEDMANHRAAHVRKYPGQLQMYMYMSEYDKGCFVLVNKLTSEMKEVWMELDYEYVESLLAKAESINRHVANETLPDRCKYDPSLCDRCSFAHICLPPVEQREELYIEMEPEIIEKLKEREVCELAGKRFKKLDAEIKDYAKKRKELVILCGDFCLQKKERKDKVMVVKITRIEEPNASV